MVTWHVTCVVFKSVVFNSVQLRDSVTLIIFRFLWFGPTEYYNQQNERFSDWRWNILILFWLGAGPVFKSNTLDLKSNAEEVFFLWLLHSTKSQLGLIWNISKTVCATLFNYMLKCLFLSLFQTGPQCQTKHSVTSATQMTFSCLLHVPRMQQPTSYLH